ncbi:MAG: hypothetical protein A2Z97_08790, partial [Bdellovibrionales bacterium GWB1_52_6]
MADRNLKREIFRKFLRNSRETYVLDSKPFVELPDGRRVFSLVTPPPKSAPARRRVRQIIRDQMVLYQKKVFSNVIPGVARTPHAATLAICYECQCVCEHCSAALIQEEVRQKKSALTLAELLSAIDEVLGLGTTCVIFTGGEPLLHPDLPELIRAVNPDKAICTLFTNGEFLNDKRVGELKAAGIFGVYVSFDSPDSGEHDRNRGRAGLFLKAAEGLKRCQEAGIPTGLSTFVDRSRLQDGSLHRMMELARNLGVLEVFLFDAIPAGRLAEHASCVLTDEEARAVQSFREDYNKKPEFPRVIHQSIFSNISYGCVAEGCPAA